MAERQSAPSDLEGIGSPTSSETGWPAAFQALPDLARRIGR